MTDQLNSQLSAFVDEALSEAESELLVRRLCRDADLRQTLARYTLIGDVLRGDSPVPASDRFARGVMMAVDGQAAPQAPRQLRSSHLRVRPLAAAAVAALALAVVGLLTLPGGEEPRPAIAALDAPATSDGAARRTAVSYNVPVELPADRYPPEVRARLNRHLVQHLATAGSRQGLVNYRNVGYVTAQGEARQ